MYRLLYGGMNIKILEIVSSEMPFSEWSCHICSDYCDCYMNRMNEKIGNLDGEINSCSRWMELESAFPAIYELCLPTAIGQRLIKCIIVLLLDLGCTRIEVV